MLNMIGRLLSKRLDFVVGLLLRLESKSDDYLKKSDDYRMIINSHWQLISIDNILNGLYQLSQQSLA